VDSDRWDLLVDVESLGYEGIMINMRRYGQRRHVLAEICVPMSR
jgi:hypothetical protein